MGKFRDWWTRNVIAEMPGDLSRLDLMDNLRYPEQEQEQEQE